VISKSPTLPPTAQAALTFLATENSTNPNRRRLFRTAAGPARGVEYGRSRKEVTTFGGKLLRVTTFEAMLRRGWIEPDNNEYTITQAGRDALARDARLTKKQQGSEGK
jgi:hypothetical protein